MHPERQAELGAIDAALQQARGGHGSLVVIDAAAGNGKSTLVAAAHAAAADASFRVLGARGGELERGYAFGAVRQLLHSAGGSADGGVLTRIFDGGTSGPPPDEFAVALALHEYVAELAAGGPLLLTVDDAHWVDAASLQWLGFLARRIDGLPAVLIVAFRPGSHLEPRERGAEDR